MSQSRLLDADVKLLGTAASEPIATRSLRRTTSRRRQGLLLTSKLSQARFVLSFRVPASVGRILSRDIRPRELRDLSLAELPTSRTRPEGHPYYVSSISPKSDTDRDSRVAGAAARVNDGADSVSSMSYGTIWPARSARRVPGCVLWPCHNTRRIQPDNCKYIPRYRRKHSITSYCDRQPLEDRWKQLEIPKEHRWKTE